jgi:hypothetical protein
LLGWSVLKLLIDVKEDKLTEPAPSLFRRRDDLRRSASSLLGGEDCFDFVLVGIIIFDGRPVIV